MPNYTRSTRVAIASHGAHMCVFALYHANSPDSFHGFSLEERESLIEAGREIQAVRYARPLFAAIADAAACAAAERMTRDMLNEAAQGPYYTARRKLDGKPFVIVARKTGVVYEVDCGPLIDRAEFIRAAAQAIANEARGTR